MRRYVGTAAFQEAFICKHRWVGADEEGGCVSQGPADGHSNGAIEEGLLRKLFTRGAKVEQWRAAEIPDLRGSRGGGFHNPRDVYVAGREGRPTKAVACLVEGSWEKILCPPALRSPAIAGFSFHRPQQSARGHGSPLKQSLGQLSKAPGRKEKGRLASGGSVGSYPRSCGERQWPAYSPDAMLSLGKDCCGKR